VGVGIREITVRPSTLRTPPLRQVQPRHSCTSSTALAAADCGAGCGAFPTGCVVLRCTAGLCHSGAEAVIALHHSCPRICAMQGCTPTPAPACTALLSVHVSFVLTCLLASFLPGPHAAHVCHLCLHCQALHVPRGVEGPAGCRITGVRGQGLKPPAGAEAGWSVAWAGLGQGQGQRQDGL